MRTVPFTKQGFSNLKKQLETEVNKRPDAVKTLTRAREMGDLSENGLYKAAKFELSDIDRKIRHLKSLILQAKVYSPVNNLVVQIGHKVTIENVNGKKDYFIVGEYEADPKQNKISNKSPLGFALMGKKAQEKVTIQAPGGTNTLTILGIYQ